MASSEKAIIASACRADESTKLANGDPRRGSIFDGKLCYVLDYGAVNAGLTRYGDLRSLNDGVLIGPASTEKPDGFRAPLSMFRLIGLQPNGSVDPTASASSPDAIPNEEVGRHCVGMASSSEG